MQHEGWGNGHAPCLTRPGGNNRDYRGMPQVVVIMLIEGHTKFGGAQAVTACRMAWEREGGPVPGCDRVAFVAVELDKVAEAYNGGVTEEVLADELSAWLYVLARGWRDKEEVEEIMGSFPPIEEWATQYGLAIDDPGIKKKYEDYQEGVMEWNSIVSEAEHHAREEGREEGRAEEREALVSRFRKLGVDEALIAQALEETTTE